MSLTKAHNRMIENAQINVLDFIPSQYHADIKSGTTTYDATSNVQAALDAGTDIIFPKGTYLVNGNTSSSEPLTVNANKRIDLQGSKLIRTTTTQGGFFKVTSGGDFFELRNGTLDSQNNTFNFYHLIDFNASACNLLLDNVNLLNNCAGGISSPTASQDTDLLYVYEAKNVYVNNCTFQLASRQGISFINGCDTVTIKNSRFEDCFLFGIDFEPNASPAATDDMYETVIIDGCVFKNNGSKSSSVYVWSGVAIGPLAIESPHVNVAFITNLHITNNDFISTDFVNEVFGTQSPALRINSQKNLVFANNKIQNLAFINIGTTSASISYLNAVISNNFVDKSIGNHSSKINSYFFDKVVVANNTLSELEIASQESYTVDGNAFETASTYAVLPRTGSNGIISNNNFDVGTYAVNTSSTTTEFLLVGNELNGSSLTGPSANLDVVRVGNSDNIVRASVLLEGDYSIISIPTATATTVADLTDTSNAGMIVVTDGGTRAGSYALYGNFTDGTNNTSYLTNVQDSGQHGSALTLVGQTIKFTHTFGSTRNFKVNVVKLA